MLGLITALGIMTLPVYAAAPLAAAQRSAICQNRATCSIGKLYEGGKSQSGVTLTVAEVHLGLNDKPDDAPDEGCHAGDKFDGGVEYWLLDGDQPPKRVLKFCNDGYGASGVGEDDVTVANGILTHTRVGGSAWRWAGTTKYTLSPWRAVSQRACSYNNLSGNNGSLTDIDFVKMTARSVIKDAAAKWNDNDVGCPDWPASADAHFTPQPTAKLLAGYNLIVPVLGSETPPAKIPLGAVIGDCVPAMTTGGANAFIVYGSPAPAGQAAEVKVIAESFQALLIQVFDPAAASQPQSAKGSWINLPHIEVWVGHDSDTRTRLPFNQLTQIGVDLSGKVYAGVGKKEPPPAVERWQGRDAAGRPVTVIRLIWNNDTELSDGVAVVYSQAEQGKQKRLAATAGVVKNRPLYLPDIMSLPNIDLEPPLPGNCRVRNGVLATDS
jgi:hypothetical protein